MIQQLTEYGQNLRAAGPNEFAIANVIALVIGELETKPVSEAYMGYALGACPDESSDIGNADSNRYETGKVVLSKKARNKHEELSKKIAIKEDGYIETYLVNETEENVWFDQFSILSTGPLIVQETHYDPWGVELSGLGYQYGGIKINPYLYNGKEANGHLGVNLFDFGARLYDPAIGRWFVIDPLAEQMRRHSPYNYALNNPMRYIDPDGMAPYDIQGAVVQDTDGGEDETQKSVLNNEEQSTGGREPVLIDIGYGTVSSDMLTTGVEYAGNFETDRGGRSGDCCGSSSQQSRGDLSRGNKGNSYTGGVKYDGEAYWGTNFIGPGPDANPYTLPDKKNPGKYLQPKDMVDAAAQKHDIFYFALGAAGVSGALFNINVRFADRILAEDASKAFFGFFRGDIDPITGSPISPKTRDMAFGIMTSFGIIGEAKPGFP